MNYQSVADTAKLWNVSERTARNYCATGKIPGAVLIGKTWNISSKYLRLLHRVLCSSLFMWDDFECAPRHLPPERVEVFPQRESQEHCRLGERTRELLRGRGKTLTALPERVKKVGQKLP